MRKFLFLHFLPILLSISFFSITIIYTKFDSNFFTETPVNIVDSTYRHITNFQGNQYYEQSFLASNDIYLLGSSELNVNTEATPYNFITENYNTKLKGIGHAGNQCFSIYSQLLANSNRLENAKIIIILSPGWFQSKSAEGTTASLFLQYNSSNYLNEILQNDSIGDFKQFETKRISDFYDEMVSPNLSVKLFYLENQSSISFLHKCLYAPIISINHTLNYLKSNFKNVEGNYNQKIIIKPIDSKAITINWDSLFMYSKNEQLKNSTNNNWGIDNDYFNEYIKGRHSTVSIVSDENNKELQDFKMLIKLLNNKKANASFIILPLNPYYYTNIKELTPLINSLGSELTNNGYKYLNFWNTDSVNFEKGILKDIMHLSSYGWYKVDKFIVETYNLAK